MTAPLSNGRVGYATRSATGPAYTPRSGRHSSDAFRRLAAAAARQKLAFFATAVAITLAGLGVALMQRAPTANAVIFWSGVGACIGLAVSLFRELTRATITSVSSLGRQRGYSVLGAAPELNASDLRDLAPDQRTPLGCLAFLPGSTFATAFRDLQGALSDESVVAFLSPDTNDGAMAAMCAAASAAQQGRRAIVRRLRSARPRPHARSWHRAGPGHSRCNCEH